MKRPIESDYISQVAYTRALEAYCDELAQPEQSTTCWKFVGHQFQNRKGLWCDFIDQKHYENTVADGTWPIRTIYTHSPVSMAHKKPEQEPVACYEGGEDIIRYKDIQLGAMLYTTPPQRNPMTDENKYRLLEYGEKIEKGDTVLGDDAVTWHPLAGWEVGIQWGDRFMMPMRRAIEAVHNIKE